MRNKDNTGTYAEHSIQLRRPEHHQCQTGLPWPSPAASCDNVTTSQGETDTIPGPEYFQAIPKDQLKDALLPVIQKLGIMGARYLLTETSRHYLVPILIAIRPKFGRREWQPFLNSIGIEYDQYRKAKSRYERWKAGKKNSQPKKPRIPDSAAVVLVKAGMQLADAVFAQCSCGCKDLAERYSALCDSYGMGIFFYAERRDWR